MSSTSIDEPSAKRSRTGDLIVPTVLESAPTGPASSTSTTPVVLAPGTIDYAAETGLFQLLQHSIGIRAATEPEVGITEYIDPSIAEISGIIKHRFTDFLVFEVGLDGNVVNLVNLGHPNPFKKAVPVVAPESVVAEPVASGSGVDVEIVAPVDANVRVEGAEGSEPVVPAVVETATEKPEAPVVQPLWNPSSEAAMAALLTPELLEDFKSFVLAGSPAKMSEYRYKKGAAPANAPPVVEETKKAWTKTRTYFHSGIIADRPARTVFHAAIRENFSGKLASEMKELENKDQVIEVKWNNKESRMRGAVRGARPPKESTENLPDFIHFTLQKTNKESHDALNSLARTLHVTSRDMGTAGTKDKRAITVQRVSIKRGTKTLTQVYNTAKGDSGRGGRGGGRGGARGGYSNGGGVDRGLRIGDLSYESYGLDLGMLKGNKFIITLRNVQTDSPETIEKAMQTLRERGFINYYGMQRFGTASVPTQAIGLALLRSNWALASSLIMRPRGGDGDDTTEARELYRKGDVAGAEKAMPRRAVAESAILQHYVQSKNETDHLSALTRIPKNLRMMYVHGWQSYVWNRMVSERIKMHGCQEPVEGDLVYVDANDAVAVEEEVAEAEEVPIVAETLEVAEAEAEAEEDVIILTKSTTKPEPAARSSRIAKARPLTALDIASKKYTIFDVVLPMPGYAIIYPTGALGELYKQVIKEDGLDWENLFRTQKEYSLTGTYRKILHLPSAVAHQSIWYSDPNVDLAQSDEDALMGRKLPNPMGTKHGEEQNKTLALRVELTLGSSTYATMALRELLKTRTSVAHQKGLTDAMEAEHAAGLEAKSVDATPAAPQETAAEQQEREEMEREERMSLAMEE